MTAAECGAKKRQGEGHCTQPAGWGTEHVGRGRCKLHGGNAGRPIIYGRYSLEHRKSLEEKRDRFLEDPEPGNLGAELAMLRALFQDYLDRLPEGTTIDINARMHAVELIQNIGGMVDRIARILNQTALTQAEVKYLTARIADALNTYVDDPALRSRILDAIFGPAEPGRLGAGAGGGVD